VKHFQVLARHDAADASRKCLQGQTLQYIPRHCHRRTPCALAKRHALLVGRGLSAAGCRCKRHVRGRPGTRLLREAHSRCAIGRGRTQARAGSTAPTTPRHTLPNQGLAPSGRTLHRRCGCGGLRWARRRGTSRTRGRESRCCVRGGGEAKVGHSGVIPAANQGSGVRCAYRHFRSVRAGAASPCAAHPVSHGWRRRGACKWRRARGTTPRASAGRWRVAWRCGVACYGVGADPLAVTQCAGLQRPTRAAANVVRQTPRAALWARGGGHGSEVVVA